jgi:hypothetical protein
MEHGTTNINNAEIQKACRNDYGSSYTKDTKVRKSGVHNDDDLLAEINRNRKLKQIDLNEYKNISKKVDSYKKELTDKNKDELANYKKTISDTYYDESNLTDLSGDELEKKKKK